MDRIREYYRDAEVVPVEFNGERIGFGVRLEPGDEPIGFAASKSVAIKRAIAELIHGGSLPEEGI